MGFAEKKVELFQMVANADEKLTGVLIEIANQYNQNISTFTEDEIKDFEKRRDDFFTSGEKGYTVEQAHLMIRNKMR